MIQSDVNKKSKAGRERSGGKSGLREEEINPWLDSW